MSFKGIVLAGGKGSRLNPLTKSVNKHLLPLFDKPLIYYSLSILMLANIKEILIIVNEKDLFFYKMLLGDGNRFGIKLSYTIQEKPSGIPEAFIIGKHFIKNSNVALILGDNFFYSQGLSKLLNDSKKKFKGAKIFCQQVKNPSAFGIVDIANNRIKSLKEKPKKTNSNLAISGLYFFDKNVSELSKNLKKSKRNETEIVDLLKIYLKNKKLNFTILGRGAAWLDTGTPEYLFQAANFVYNIEKRQGFKIACLEEIAFLNGWIKKNKINESIKFYGNSSYSDYLKKLVK
jgi:glucose-1-phosphate thymidylyltransferase